MANIFKINDKEYDLDKISEKGKLHIKHIQFTSNKLNELENLKALLQRAKSSYMQSLKEEIIRKRSGFMPDAD